ncbi:MAG: helix-turn-helix domain-containing protein [Micrococcus sp.]|nr:helix-turn-helix domain-containing protein [Micrococcus sp.]
MTTMPSDAQPMDREAAIRSLVQHLAEHSQELGERLVVAYKERIVEYRSLPAGPLDEDIAHVARQNVLTLLEWLSGDAQELRGLEEFKNSAVRRFRQGVSVQAVLHAYRVWGQVVWEEVSRVAECRLSPTTGFAVAGEIMRYVNTVSLVVANSYLEESAGIISDRHLAEREALEELISGRSVSERVSGYLLRLGVHLEGRNSVVVLHRRPGAGTAPLRDHLATVRHHLPSAHRSALVGVREEEIVVVLPAVPTEGAGLADLARGLAAGLEDFVVGVGRVHEGMAGVATAYREAQDAMRLCRARGERGRACFYTDVLLQRVLEASGLAGEVVEETVGPLAAYDARHQAQLLPTLRTYVAHRFNLTRTAAELHVQPNTVRYRLERIHEVCGRDPSRSDDLLLLALGAKAEHILPPDRQAS